FNHLPRGARWNWHDRAQQSTTGSRECPAVHRIVAASKPSGARPHIRLATPYAVSTGIQWPWFFIRNGLTYDHSSHMRIGMRKIQLKDAKAKLSTVVDDAVRG